LIGPSGRRKGICKFVLHQSRNHRIAVDVRYTCVVRESIRYTLIEMTALPNFEPAPQTKRKAALDKLNCLLQGNLRRGCNQRVNMVRHRHESVKCEPS